jgi:hypothetical protein
MDSPYRRREPPSIAVEGEPSTTTFLWAAWSIAAILVATALFVDNNRTDRMGC